MTKNLHIFCTKKFNEIFRKDATYDNIKRHKKQGFALSLQDTSLEKPQGGDEGEGGIDSSQPFLSLKTILIHREVLTYVLEHNVSNNLNFKTFKDGTSYTTNSFLNANPNILEICMYHDFGVVNPLGNKTHKHHSTL